MMHKPIQLKSVSFSLPYKICFEDFTTTIAYGSRIAIIGRNGSGKSTLLSIIQGLIAPTDGMITIPEDIFLGGVPQIIEDYDSLSGGQRFNKALTQVLAQDLNLLLLDEPTNHLDASNRKSLMRMLRTFPGTLIIASHDVELLQQCVDIIWHIDNGQIHIFSGSYDDYIRETEIKRSSIEEEVSQLNRQKKDTHRDLMKEQSRAAGSRTKGEKSIKQRKWPTIVSSAKALRAEETSGRKRASINKMKQALSDKLSELRLPEIIKPKFSLRAENLGGRMLVSICGGSMFYRGECTNKPVLRDIHFSLMTGDRVAIQGDNGSGKSTLIKGILGKHDVKTTGTWHLPNRSDIGYLDQHYGTLSPEKTVLETIQDLVPKWPHGEVRRHLNDFLFRKNEEVEALVATLSGGEKARLSLAQISAKTPKLLILDEITNNLDLETRDHVIQVLKEYPGALIVISHDRDFLSKLNITHICQIRDGSISCAGS